MLSGNRGRKCGMWYVVDSGSKKNVMDALTPRQFHEAIENGNIPQMVNY